MDEKRIAQIMYGKVHHVFEGTPDGTWADDPNGNKVPDWPPDPDGNKPLLIDVTGQGINEGDGYNPVTHQCIPMPVSGWNEETFEFDIATRPESDTDGINS